MANEENFNSLTDTAKFSYKIIGTITGLCVLIHKQYLYDTEKNCM